MIRFYRSIELLRDNLSSCEFSATSMDDKTKKIILEGFGGNDICDSVHALVKFFMTKLIPDKKNLQRLTDINIKQIQILNSIIIACNKENKLPKLLKKILHKHREKNS